MAQVQVKSEVTGKVWELMASQGASVSKNEVLLVIESMKMEIPVTAPVAGRVAALLVGSSDDIAEGQIIAIIDIAE